jgi:hypothetical protein
MRTIGTIVVGGGIAGLACARRLHQAGADFRLISDRLGGRMYALGPMQNLGASYITSDYRHTSRFIDRGPSVGFRNTFFLDRGCYRTILDTYNVRRARALARLYRHLIKFRARLNRLRARAPWQCQAGLLRGDSLLQKSVEEPADVFIKQNGLEELNDIFTNLLVRSTLFVETRDVNVFYFLAVLMPIFLRTCLADFSQTLPRLTHGWSDRVQQAKVEAVEELSDGSFRVAAGNDELHARNVVIATPGHNTRQFFPQLAARQPGCGREISVATVHVAGQRRAEYLPGRVVFLPRDHHPTVLLPIGNGCDLFFTATPDVDISRYYASYRITATTRWKTALTLAGCQWRPLAPRPHLYMIGDYNICGLEDSYLTGLYAAHHILGLADGDVRVNLS